MTSNVEVNENKPYIRYIADGTNTTFDFPFQIFNPTDLVVYFEKTVQSTDLYQISIDIENKNGTVTFTTAPAAGTQITLSRELNIERKTYFQEQSAIRPETLDREFDYQIACTQQLADAINRTMISPVYENNENVSMILPSPNPGKAILWSADGQKLENSTIEINNLTAQMQAQVNQAAASAQTATEKADIAIDALEHITIPLPENSDAGKFLKTDGVNSVWDNVPVPSELNTKANTDLSNVDTNIDYIVEKYDDGNGNWYRIYKSGWVEQCQRIQLTNTLTEYNLLKPYSSTNYYLGSIAYSDTNVVNNWAFNRLIVAPSSTSKFKAKQESSSNFFSIYSCGQGADA